MSLISISSLVRKYPIPPPRHQNTHHKTFSESLGRKKIRIIHPLIPMRQHLQVGFCHSQLCSALRALTSEPQHYVIKLITKHNKNVDLTKFEDLQ